RHRRGVFCSKPISEHQWQWCSAEQRVRVPVLRYVSSSSTGTRSWRRTCYGWVLTIRLAMLNVRTYTSRKRRANHAGHTSQKGCATFSLRTNSHRSSSLVLVIP
uniref:Uncharacterized protein n=1 Tax=Oryza glaberrima TaxID=4538 RepID=I1PK70_ORYGL